MTRFSLRFLLFAALAAILAACASKPPATPAAPEPPPPAKQAEVSPQYRAQLHTDLGAGYYERGQMEIALAELNEALTLDPNNARRTTSWGPSTRPFVTSKGRAEFPAGAGAGAAGLRCPRQLEAGTFAHGRARESIAEFEQAIKNSVSHARDRAHQCRRLQRVAWRNAAQKRFTGARCRFQRTMQQPHTASPSSTTKRHALKKRARL
jgi:tetratricopeptide (TPR) repeat protein